eukprot:1176339-Prorocentrum_minimum.AAC.7
MGSDEVLATTSFALADPLSEEQPPIPKEAGKFPKWHDLRAFNTTRPGGRILIASESWGPKASPLIIRCTRSVRAVCRRSPTSHQSSEGRGHIPTARTNRSVKRKKESTTGKFNWRNRNVHGHECVVTSACYAARYGPPV